MAWKPFLIKDFIGISTKVNPPANAAASIIGLDLRGTEGALVSPPVYEDYKNSAGGTISPPTDSYFDFETFLGMTTHYFPALIDANHPKGAEVLIVAYKGIITPIGGSLPSGFDGKMVGFWMYPYWNGNTSQWVNGWKWINETRVTSYSDIGSGTLSLYGLALTYPYHYTVYDKANAQFGYVLGASSYNVATNRTAAWGGGSVIVMAGHYPLAYLNSAGIYGVTAETLDWSKVLDDIRVGFGGQANRLAVGMGHRKKYFQITGWSYKQFNEVMFDPYNTITDSGTYNFYLTAAAPVTGKKSLLEALNNYRNPSVRITALLDDFNEFLVFESTLEESITFLPLENSAPNLAIIPEIRFATMNKRVTAFRCYVASGEIAEGKVYTFVQEIRVSEGTTGVGWEFDSAGQMILTTGTNPVVSDRTVYNAAGKNSFIVDGDMFAEGLSTTLDKDYLGYTPTFDLVKDWQQALITGKKTHVVGPYIDQKYQNFIMLSAIGADAEMYDVITSQDYIPLENRDGNEIVGVELLANMDLLVGRRNNVQQVDPNTGLPRTLISESGLVDKRGLLKVGDSVIIMSDFDLYSLSYNNLENLTKDTIRDEYRSNMSSLGVNFGVNMVRDVFGGSFRFAFVGSAYEFIFTPGKGFVKQLAYTETLADEILGYAIQSDGSIIRMLAAFDGHSTSYLLQKVNNSDYQEDTFEVQFVPIDSKLIESMPENARLLIRSVWVNAKSKYGFRITPIFDGVAGTTITVPEPTTLLASPNEDETPIYFPRRLPPGKNCKNFALKIHRDIGDDFSKIAILSCGFEYDIIPMGLHG